MVWSGKNKSIVLKIWKYETDHIVNKIINQVHMKLYEKNLF